MRPDWRDGPVLLIRRPGLITKESVLVAEVRVTGFADSLGGHQTAYQTLGATCRHTCHAATVMPTLVSTVMARAARDLVQPPAPNDGYTVTKSAV